LADDQEENCHALDADLHGDGQWRLVAVEVTRDGGHGLSVYRPIGFGYEGEWHSETLPHLDRVAAIGPVVLCWGRDTTGARDGYWSPVVPLAFVL